MGTMVLQRPSQKILNKMQELDHKEVTENEMIGINVYILRETKNLTQKKLSAESGLSISSISKIERGKRVSDKTINRICDFFGHRNTELNQKLILDSDETGINITVRLKKKRKMLDLDRELLGLLGVK
ncbi:helix-turn-helix domain-containing protein [Chengkuizengella axinellae]|uniref:Helix-turn-helix transcriptional regulator n=1 Tax=Chengkuizengella axinellae TaxID=3064388 RepID=A0ABT9J3D3_9BACL|nr:helix-turn-helix transcriptional regulator [Chengkuizengella sp. 2205SS18-9]MDP5275520.1 helix-turn-helix transcriptional regulator [Chengkuizengella sp. 2205SS18-9]